MKWNRSVFYAIAVGHLADRINGAAGLHTPPPKAANLSRKKVKALQGRLNKLGYDVGEPDGIMGAKSSKGLRQFQQAQGLVADGFPSQQVFQALGIK